MPNTISDVNWSIFELYHEDKNAAFERMCRMLFNQRFFDGQMILHSNPNNPGVEILPVIDPKSSKKISFQAKYFETMDYEQILHSCEKAVEHYAGKLDQIYLYCNKNVTTTAKSYLNIVNFLGENDIELIPVTDEAILEEVMRNELIARYFFNQVTLSQELLSEKLAISLSTLGPRYNDAFNVHTTTESNFNLFLCNKNAVDSINKHKKQCIENIKTAFWQSDDYKKYADSIWKKIKDIPDITVENIEECLGWSSYIAVLCKTELSEIEAAIVSKDALLTKEKDKNTIYNLREEIADLTRLLNLPDEIAPNPYAKELITKQIVVVNGEAGTGKSQLFASAAKALIDDRKQAVLLLGGSYLSEQAIAIQTASILDLGLSFDELLYKFEGYGVENNCYCYIFIDAINETTYKDIWLMGLPTILQQLSHCKHVKLALSVRDGYENLVFSSSIKSQLENGQICRIRHSGFAEKGVNATKAFLDFYGIPFLPSYYLQNEMRNPLFLKLFCETYSGENYDLFSLFEKLIEKAEQEAMRNCEIRDNISVVKRLLQEIANIFITTNSRVISQDDLFSLPFWNTYGLSVKKIPFVASLCKSGLLLSYASSESEHYQLGYNLLDDFICAKAIVDRYSNEQELQKYVCDTILAIHEGTIYQYSNLDVCVILLSLWAEKHGTELVDSISENITDGNSLEDFSERYLASFLWRKATSVNRDTFVKFIRSYPLELHQIWQVLIENASKTCHPLNALFLHDILIRKDLSARDAMWTICINDLADNEERLFQLVLLFAEGNTLDGLSRENTELLLILFIWLFTSSNRFLRDKSSKATIELLKTNFDLCLPLLKRFEGVNDPYVIQRLYGVIFGACTKCQNIVYEQYEKLIKHIYENIFLAEQVYPDILLRDYARMILEKFIYDYPEASKFINKKAITPPYKSDSIPTVERQEYYQRDAFQQGYNNVNFSMIMDVAGIPGMYGDFGRYVFQSALNHFQDVDLINTYHYSMQFIRDTLGYSDELFGVYDSRQRYFRYERNETKKIERIGKKYQWITIYNILARVSDHYLLKEWNKEPYRFEGPWEPYVRDFDPTLNKSSMKIDNPPNVLFPNYSFEFLPVEPTPDQNAVVEWTAKTTPFFSSLPSYLCVKDESGTEWCALYLYEEQKNKEHNYNDISGGIGRNSQSIWLITEAFFVRDSDLQQINEHFSSQKINVQNLPSASDVYQLFNREYVWSPSYNSIFGDYWIEYELESGEYKIETETYEIPDFEHICYDDDGSASIPMVMKDFQKKIPIDSKLIKIAPAYSQLLWEEEYDASQDETTRLYIPHCDLINSLGLKQKDADGFFYAPNNDLVCFDCRLTGDRNCFLFRMDYLENFLEKEGLRICWKCIGEKQYFLGNHEQVWSSWDGLFFAEDSNIKGEMQRRKTT